jgi:internalin A
LNTPLAMPAVIAPDAEDLKKVRSFLPGRIIGRTAAAIALLITLAGVTGGLGYALRTWLGVPPDAFPLPIWQMALIAGLVIGGAQVGWELWELRRTRVLKALAGTLEIKRSGYFRLDPYGAEDREAFDRADGAHRKLTAWLASTREGLLYLTGDSGCGKSSALAAYAAPALREQGWTVLETRAWQDPEAEVRQETLTLLRELGAKPKADADSLSLLSLAARRSGKQLLVIVDQFEEFAILHGSDRAEDIALKQRFTTLARSIAEGTVPGVRLLLVMRAEYETLPEDLGLPLLRQGETWMKIGAFTLQDAAAFLRGSTLTLEPDTTARLLASASLLDDLPGYVRPITVNMIGHVLSQPRAATAGETDAGRLVRRYVTDAIGRSAIREIAPRVLERMVTAQGTKQPVRMDDLCRDAGLRLGEARAVLMALNEAALARPLDRNQSIWELSHDFIARVVATVLGRDQPARLRRAAAYAAPIALGLCAVVAAGLLAWQAGEEHRAMARLAEVGLSVETTNGSQTLILRAGAGQPALDVLETIPDYMKRRWTSAVLTGTEVVNLEPLKNLTALTSLDLLDTPVANLEPLRSLTDLTWLDLMKTQVANLEPLKGLTALTSLNLSETPVADLEPLKGLTALTSLGLMNTPVANLEPLKGLTALTSLDLMNTQVANLEPLKGLTALTSLDLNGTQVADLEPLAGLPNLRWVLGSSADAIATLNTARRARGLPAVSQ